MPRPHRIQIAGGTYHVATRGVDTQRVFRDASDRRRFLAILADVVGRYGWRCYAYCLMDTHYHVLIETPSPTLALGFQRLNGLYAGWVNRRHGRRGHLFGGRYASAAVESDSHLLAAVRYVVLSPVRAGLCPAPAAWSWSSFRATAGLTSPPRFLAVGRLLTLLGRDAAEARARYVAFVLDGAPAADQGAGMPVPSGAGTRACPEPPVRFLR